MGKCSWCGRMYRDSIFDWSGYCSEKCKMEAGNAKSGSSSSGGSAPAKKNGCFLKLIAIIVVAIVIAVVKSGDSKPADSTVAKSTVPTTITSTNVITNASVNLRSGPSADTILIISITKGTKVEVLDKTPVKGWVKVKVNNEVGYINGSYLNY